MEMLVRFSCASCLWKSPSPFDAPHALHILSRQRRLVGRGVMLEDVQVTGTGRKKAKDVNKEPRELRETEGRERGTCVLAA
jgi:hypothetical protein